MKFIWIIGLALACGCGSTGRLVQDIPAAVESSSPCLDLYQNAQWKEALECLEEIPASRRDQAYYDLFGSTQMAAGDPVGAVESFRTAIELDTNDQNPFLYYKYGENLWRQHQFAQAGEAMQTYRAAVPEPRPDIARQADYYIRSFPLADSLYQTRRIFEPMPLPTSVNTDADELGISMRYDRRYMILTRRTKQEDLYESRQVAGKWETATPIEILNTPDNEGAAAISGDGQYLVFTACNRARNVGSCDLYFSAFSDTGWMSPALIPGVNSRNWDSQPTLSTDGRVVIFSSERPGGYGGRDLWLSVRTDQGWVEPVNLGPSVNTAGNEENPFLHSDEYTLYFTSDYRPGFGGRDLFMSHRLRGNEWSPAENLGFPINSIDDEEGIFIESSGRKGYFSSARRGGFDLYQFELDPAIRPRPALLFQLIVLDSVTGQPLPGVEVNIYDWTRDILVRSVTTDQEGFAAFLMSGGRKYGITASKSGFTLLSFSRIIEDGIGQDLSDTLYLAPVTESTTVILENVHFETGESRLLEGSATELDLLAEYLLENPEISIILTGHTDNIGTTAANMNLSRERALSVKNYLVGKGVAKTRIEAQGMGESRPIASNDTEEGRQKNRRTEISIIQ